MKGAELIAIPTYGYWEKRTRTRAVENGLFIATAFSMSEGASVVTPFGDVAARGDEKGYGFAVIDLNQAVRMKYLSCASYGSPNEYLLSERRGGTLYEELLNDPLCSKIWQE